MRVKVSEKAVDALLAREEALFVQRNPKSKALAGTTEKHWLRGVPMHWMVDWGTPFPLFIEKATGVTLTDADGNSYTDFCLGDTGAMFGHAPPAVVKTLQEQAALGLSTMLPSGNAVKVGELLADRFGLPLWQITATASDANRAVLRWCRAVTGRKNILVFNHCYHGCVDDTFVTADGGVAKMVDGLVGEPRDLTAFTKVVEFNDVAALALLTTLPGDARELGPIDAPLLIGGLIACVALYSTLDTLFGRVAPVTAALRGSR